MRKSKSVDSINKFSFKEGLMLFIVLCSFIIALIFYSKMPEMMVSHWGAQGEPNGYSSSFWGTFLLPIMLLFMFFILFFVPRMDPLKENILKFKGIYLNFCILVLLFMVYVQALIIRWNLGHIFNIGVWLVPAFSILFFYMGVLILKAKQNMSIGIRTPWTLKDVNVWNQTHKRASSLIMIASVFSLCGLIFQKYAVWFILIPILAVMIYAIIYSYVLYAKLHK
ncbi:MAG: DUF1648 domain-containing protein [Candidatus Woesearchaeota archaeon]|jgi:uncharacterized membrane protein